MSSPKIKETLESIGMLMDCLWVENDDGAFETSCGEVFEFTNDGPTENNFKFCPYCGKELHKPLEIRGRRPKEKPMNEPKTDSVAAVPCISLFGAPADWPRTTKDTLPGGGREWIHEIPPRYYLHRYPENPALSAASGKWAVIDRYEDLVDGKFHTKKSACIKAFVDSHNAAGQTPAAYKGD